MNQDLKMQRECWQWVQETLGTDSDSAAAYYACSECSARWGAYDLQRQETMRWCPQCEQGCRPVPVEAIRPSWWADQYPPGWGSVWGFTEADDLEPEPEPEPEPAFTRPQVGEMVDIEARKLQRSGRVLKAKNVTKAAEKVQKKLASLGITMTIADLKAARKRWYSNKQGLAKWHAKKAERLAQSGYTRPAND